MALFSRRQACRNGTALRHHDAGHTGGPARPGAAGRDGRPYSAAWPDPASWQPPGRISPLFTCESSSCAPGLHGIRAELAAGRPVVVGVFLSRTYRFPADWTRVGAEVLLAPDRHEPIDQNDGHAMVIVGHGHNEDEPVLLLRNSWGSR